MQPVQSLFPLDRPPQDTPADHPATPGAAIAAAAATLVPILEAGDPLTSDHITTALSAAWRRLQDPTSWNSKSCYEAAEAATVMFLRSWGPSMLRAAATPAELIAMADKLSKLEPRHSHRSEHQVAFDQFSTPLPLAAACFIAAAVQAGDVVLEPSAGTGILAAFPGTFLADPAQLHLNEISATRADLLNILYPHAAITRHNAEQIRDRLPAIRPDLIIMNPPFGARPTVSKRQRRIDLVHLKAAYSALRPAGRLVAILGAGSLPGSKAWRKAFPANSPAVLFAARVPGRVYSRRGTAPETLMVVLEHPDLRPDPDDRADATLHIAADIEDLVARLADIPARIVRDGPPQPVALRPATDAAPSTAPTGSIWSAWSPTTFRFPASVEHPTPLVESAAMADVRPPAPDYRPLLPPALVLDGILSNAQLESVALAGAAHQRLLPNLYRVTPDYTLAVPVDASGTPVASDVALDQSLSSPVQFRQGWMLGDGTGCGKGRQAAAVILDRWNRGQKRALWISQSSRLLHDARRDWRDLNQDEYDIFPLSDYRPAATIGRASGILFTTYATLRAPGRPDRQARLDQIIQWISGTDETARNAFEGIIVFDEAHAMANAAGSAGKRGDTQPSQQGLAGIRLQNALPGARVLYASATGASTIHGLAYAPRLGLWGGDATAFSDRADFVSAMEQGGVAAMEIVARDLKAFGLYQARALAYHGVEIDILEHKLTPPQRDIWDQYAAAFKIIHLHIDEALAATGAVRDGETLNPAAKSAAYSAFEQAKQRFFGHLLAAMKCPTLIRSIERDLRAGLAPVIQLVSTGEALLERRLAELPASEHQDLSIDLTPREYVIEYLARAFPTTLQEETVDDDGNIRTLPARDADGNLIECQEAIEARDSLILQLGALPPMPAAIDILTHHFGHQTIAEVTGRHRRMLASPGLGGNRLAVSSRPPSANLTEAAAFMDGTKRILLFSTAGGTGRSYHSDLSCPNQARRIHYLLEPGWRADVAIQGLGRTHRTRQASAPLFRPVTTDVKGERRFIATIARRLDSLGAITRGQRDSQSSMGDDSLFRAEDNLESLHALKALRLMYLSLHHDYISAWPESRFAEATGLALSDAEGGLKDNLPPMPQFLNRLLALPIAEQNDLFQHFERRLDAVIQDAKDAGTYNQGVETISAQSLTVCNRHDGPAGTQIFQILRRDPLNPLGSETAAAEVERATLRHQDCHLLVNSSSGRAAISLPATSAVTDDGALERRLRIVRPNATQTITASLFASSRWVTCERAQWSRLWDAEIDRLPPHREQKLHLVAGTLLRAWHLLPTDNLRIRRLTTDAGEHLIGRLVDVEDAIRLRANAGDPSTALQLPPEQVLEAVLDRNAKFFLANRCILARRLVLGRPRLEIRGVFDASDIAAFKRLGATTELIAWQTIVFCDAPAPLRRLLARHPIQADPF